MDTRNEVFHRTFSLQTGLKAVALCSLMQLDHMQYSFLAMGIESIIIHATTSSDYFYCFALVQSFFDAHVGKGLQLRCCPFEAKLISKQYQLYLISLVSISKLSQAHGTCPVVTPPMSVYVRYLSPRFC